MIIKLMRAADIDVKSLAWLFITAHVYKENERKGKILLRIIKINTIDVLQNPSNPP